MKIAVYPGSFDPITMGHLNIIERAAKIFDKVYVCVMVNADKRPTFTAEERLDLVRRSVAGLENVTAEASDGLLVDYARSRDAKIVVKGLRALSDFDWEFQMALTNKKMAPEIDTLFLAADMEYTYLSSTVVREMAKYGADLASSVPEAIISDVIKKFHDK